MAEEVIGLLFGVDGGGSIDGRSGQQIVSDLTKIVNQINSGKSTVPKVQLKFDTSHAKTALQELRSQLQEIAGMGNISVSGMSSRGGSGGSAGVKQDAENYRALTATVKQYYAALAEVEKIQMKSTAVSSSGGVWSTTDAQYDARIQKVNQLKMEFDRLGISVNQAGMVEMNSAQMLNITEEQRAMLLTQVQSAITANGLAHEKSAAQISAAWDKNAAKVHEYILRMKEVASKNAEVAAMMSQLDALATSGNPRNLDQLTTGFATLQQKVRETGADVQTFGQKLSKTFGSQLRYMLTSMVYMKALQFLRDLYNNVVELDKAMTDLQIASGKTREEIRELTEDYSKLGKEIGATTLEVAKSADTWLRQGYAAHEANTLIKNSMMLSKLGQIESAEAAKNLTSAMKGYKVEVEDSIGIVDKFTAVDMVAAASAGDIATAMSETATSANIAGVSMDRLIGYLAVVKEVTQDGAESVGTFYKTLFARMNNVKAGKFVDDETGEALNDVEKVLGELGIALRDTNGLFRDSGEVLDEVGRKWEDFDNVQQHAIATAFAGTRQQEKFIVLMENYETAMNYATVATESAGTAMEKYEVYANSVEGKMNSLKATFEELSTTILSSDWLITGIELLSGLLTVLNGILSFGDSFLVKAALVIGVVYLAIAAYGKLKGVFLAAKLNIKELIALQMALAGSQATATTTTHALTAALIKYSSTGLLGIITLIPRAIIAIGVWIASMLSAKTATLSFKAALDLLNVNPVMLAITAVVLAIVGAVAAINKFANAAAEASAEAKEHAKSMKEAADKAKEEQDALDELINKYEELKSKGTIDSDTRKEIRDVQKQINLLVKGEAAEWDMVNGSLDENLKKLKQLRAEKAGESLKAYQQSYSAAQTSSNLAYESDRSAAGWAEWAANWAGLDLVVDGWDKQAAEILNGVSGVSAEWDSNLFSTFTDINFDADGAEEYVDRITAAMNALENDMNYDHLHSKVYSQLSSLKSVYESYTSTTTEAADQLLEGVVTFSGATLEANGAVINSLEDYEKFKQSMIDAAMSSEYLKDALASQAVTQQTVTEAVNDYMATNYADLYDKLAAEVAKSNYQLKTFLEILDEVQGEFDILSQALDDMDEYGFLSADTLSKLLDPKNGYPALAKYLTMTANGYTIAADALEQYIKEQQDAYVLALIMAEEGTEAYDIAYQNLERFLAVMATLQLTKEIERETKALENERDAWEDQLDKYKELIDLRKDLLDTYVEELEYQKELEKKQRAVSTLQTKLSVARLDSSAAGQARVRELEAELKEAQEELEDFTLEHAIDVLTDQLDNQYKQYENFIETKVSEITAAINGVTAAIQGNAQSSSEQIKQLMEQYKTEHPEVEDAKTAASAKEAAFKAAQDYVTSHGMLEGDKNRWGQDPNFRPLLSAYVDAGGSLDDIKGKTNTVRGNTSGSTTPAQKEKMVEYAQNGLRMGTKTYTQSKYNSKLKVIDGVTYLSTHENGSHWSDRTDLYVKKDEGYSVTKTENGNVYMDWHSFKPVYQLQKYHTGGFVGDFSALTSNEEFAKLLKGEFVSTPAQMKRFMEETLPKIANYSATGGSNEFNAPLIEITCESVTTEALPELERIVNEAVKEIKRELDSGMSRTGFKRTPTKRLT